MYINTNIYVCVGYKTRTCTCMYTYVFMKYKEQTTILLQHLSLGRVVEEEPELIFNRREFGLNSVFEY